MNMGTAVLEKSTKKSSRSTKKNSKISQSILEELILSKVKVLIKEEINKTIIAENKKKYDLLERMVRVEEGLKNVQKEMVLIHKRVDETNKRIDSLSSTIKWTVGIGFIYISILMVLLKIFS